MNITTKISLFFSFISLFLVICIFVILKDSERKTLSFEDIQVEKNIKIFFEALYSKVDLLNNIAYEYSSNKKIINILEEHIKRDKKRYFIKDKYTHFILFNKNKQFISGDVYDINSDEFISTPNEIKNFFKSKDLNKYLKNKEEIHFLTLDYEKVLFTIEEVKKANELLGYIFIGRTLDSSFLSNLTKITHSYISFLPSYVLKNKNELKIKNSFINYDINRVDDKNLFSFIELFDEFDNSSFFISMKINRDFFIQISKNNQFLFYIFIATFILLIISIYFFIDKLFAKRIKNITNIIKKVSKSSSLELKIKIDYNDEISYLSKKINEMFISINNKQHEQLKKERDFLQSVLDSQKNIILITDGNDIESTNKKFVDIFKTKDHFMTNIALLDNQTQANLINFAKKYESYENPAKLKVEDDNHKYFIFDVQKLDMKKYLICMNDISSYNEKICHLEQKATIDELTSVYNKNTITSILYCWLEVKDFCLIIFDIDYFKKINDTYGHYIGDCILRDLSKLVKSFLHKEDIIGRFGGEEFIVLVDDSSNENIINIATRLKQAVENYNFIYENYKINVTISLGTTFCKRDEKYEVVYKRADEALYEAKKSGRNKVCYK